MVASVIGPDNGIWGPGLVFRATSDRPDVTIPGDHWHVFWQTHGTSSDVFNWVAEAWADDNSSHDVDLVVAAPDVRSFGNYRAGLSAAQDVFMRAQLLNNANQVLDQTPFLGPFKWDPVLQIVKMLGTGGGGGLTPEQAQQLADIHAFVSKVYRNQP